MQALNIEPIVIERVLNHVEPNKLRRTYHTFDYNDNKREAWQKLGERLCKLASQPTASPGATSNSKSKLTIKQQ